MNIGMNVPTNTRNHVQVKTAKFGVMECCN